MSDADGPHPVLDEGAGGPPLPPLLLVEIIRLPDGNIQVRSPGLGLEGIELELLRAVTMVRRQLDAQAVLRVLAQRPRVTTARGVPPGMIPGIG